MEIIKLSLIGLVLGLSMVIPGLSVATLAVAFNIYDRLLSVIVPNLKKIFNAWKFWLPFVIFGAIGLLFSSKAISVLFEKYSTPTYWFFIGIIAGSIPLVYSKTRKTDSVLPSVSSIVCCIVAFAVMLVFKIIQPEEGMTVYTELTLPLAGILVLSGVIAAAAMIIPGISGSFMLLVIGMYRTVVQAVSDLNIFLLIPFGLGAAAGLLLCAALIRFLIKKAEKQTYGFVLGLVAGSIVVLFPGSFGNGASVVASFLCYYAGFAVSFFIGKKNA